MKTLLLMRHSHAVANNPAYHDKERPLTERGRRLAHATAELLASTDIHRIVCSSAARTVETAEIVSNECGISFESHDSLYLAPARSYRNACRDVPDSEDTVLVVGHNPGIAALICSWADDVIAVTPATVARYRVNIDSWKNMPQDGEQCPVLDGLISEGRWTLGGPDTAST